MEFSEILWSQGESNYNNYRIPSLIVSKENTLLAFCEGREAGDAGDIDILLRRSKDNGKTWEEQIIVWDDSFNTCGNPCPVIDMETGRIILFMTWNLGSDDEYSIIRKRSQKPRKPYMTYSDDDGLTWSEPQDMSISCKLNEWGWYAAGPSAYSSLCRLPNGNVGLFYESGDIQPYERMEFVTINVDGLFCGKNNH